MGLRTTLANSFISTGRSLGEMLGLEMAVEVSDHSINTRMEATDQTKRAWDSSLYKSGNLFIDGKANPIKPRVNENIGISNPDTVEVEEGEVQDGDEEAENEEHVQLISSGRYQEYMRQELIEQLLTPETRWNKMLYGLIGVGALQFVTIIVVLYATGSFA